MTEPTVNIPLLRKAVEWAEAEAVLGWAGAWDQSYYVVRGERSCGTAYCIAGWTLHQAGMTDDEIARTTDAASRAADMLGIKRWAGEGDHLFAGDNTIEDVRRIAEEIAGEPL